MPILCKLYAFSIFSISLLAPLSTANLASTIFEHEEQHDIDDCLPVHPTSLLQWNLTVKRERQAHHTLNIEKPSRLGDAVNLSSQHAKQPKPEPICLPPYTWPCMDIFGWANTGGWIAVAIAAVIYGYVTSSGSTTTPRDGRWDMVKFWCMFMVLWSHALGFWYFQPDFNGFPQEFASHFHMPGFSFVSGVFAAGWPVVDLTAGGKVTISFSKLKGTMCSLVLVNFSYLPVGRLLRILNQGFVPGEIFPSIPVVGIHFWYLGALFVWILVTPLICTLRWPIAISAVISIVFRSGGKELGPSFYFVFFVLGFVLGGGGAAGEDPKEHRQRLEAKLSESKSRVFAFLVLSAWLLLYKVHDMPAPFGRVISPNYDFSRFATPWDLGGWFTDAARISFNAVLLFSFLVLCFALPSCDTLSTVGSNTLYVYVLHEKALIENISWNNLVHENVPHHYHVLTVGLISFATTLLLGSEFVKRLTQPFLQPQWLVDLIVRETPSKQIARETPIKQ